VHPERLRFAALQLLGGPAVLGSYVYGFTAWPDAVSAMWGGVPEAIRPVYTAWMFVAATGYLVFTARFFFATDPEAARLLGGRRYATFHALYAAVLVGSALWMPATKLHLDGALPFALVWLDLLVVAAGSLGLLAAAATLTPRHPAPWRTLTIAGGVGFCVQTVLLDGIIWPLLFTPVG
jgi:hypothetical protein